MTSYTIEIPEDKAVFGRTTSAFANFGYSAAVRAHDNLFIAGTIGRRADGTIPETIEEILRLEKLDLSALVDVTSHHVDLHQHLSGFVAAKQRHIVAPYPTWTARRNPRDSRLLSGFVRSALDVPGHWSRPLETFTALDRRSADDRERRTAAGVDDAGLRGVRHADGGHRLRGQDGLTR